MIKSLSQPGINCKSLFVYFFQTLQRMLIAAYCWIILLNTATIWDCTIPKHNHYVMTESYNSWKILGHHLELTISLKPSSMERTEHFFSVSVAHLLCGSGWSVLQLLCFIWTTNRKKQWPPWQTIQESFKGLGIRKHEVQGTPA